MKITVTVIGYIYVLYARGKARTFGVTLARGESKRNIIAIIKKTKLTIQTGVRKMEYKSYKTLCKNTLIRFLKGKVQES